MLQGHPIFDESYDVIIVGAGPAGSAVAIYLARANIKVLLLDRFRFPRDKTCGDALMPPSLDELERLGLLNTIKSTYHEVNFVAYQSPSGPASQSAISPNGLGYIVPRIHFDALLVAEARQAGAHWLDQCTVSSIDRSAADFAYVHGQHNGQAITLRAPIVIVANGSTSQLSSALRNDLLSADERRVSQEEQQHTASLVTRAADDWSRYVSRRGYYEVTELQNVIEFSMGNAQTLYHYCWVFPVSRQLANVGIIASYEQSRSHKEALNSAFISFIEQDKRLLKPSGSWRAAPLNTGLRGVALAADHILCVGDAAALVEPASGEGISNALWSARIAAGTAQQALHERYYGAASFSPYALSVKKLEASFEKRLAYSKHMHITN